MKYVAAFIIGLVIGGLCYLIPVSIHNILHPVAILFPFPILAAYVGYENLAITIALFQAPFYTFFYNLGKSKRTKKLIFLSIVFVHIIASAFIIHNHIMVYGLFLRN